MTEVEVLRAENRRLRTILDGIARSGLGQGTLVEVSQAEDHRVWLTVCRADVNEDEFLEQVREAILELGAALGCIREVVETRRTGVTAGDPNQGSHGGSAR